MTDQTPNPKAPFPAAARPETQAAQALGWIEPQRGDLPRLSVGTENVEDLIDDPAQALDHVYGAEGALSNREGIK